MNHRIFLFILFILSLVIRLIFFLNYPDQQLPDSLTYELLGNKFFIENYEGFDPIYIYASDGHMPLYSILSYLVGGRINLILVDIFFSSLSVIIIYLFAKELFKDKNIGILTAMIFSIYPFSIFYSLSGMTETLYVFFIILSFYFLYSNKLILASISLVLSIYLRPSIEMFYPLIIFSYFIFVKNLGLKFSFFQILKYFFIYIIFMSPWWFHNYIKYDSFVRTNLSMGEILYIGNNPLNKSGGGISGIDFSFENFEDEYGASNFSNPIVRDNVLREAAIQYILDNPISFIKLSIIKFKRFWQLYPYAKEYSSIYYKLISIISLLPLYILSLLFIFTYKKSIKLLIPIILFILFLNFVHIISISSIRYRFPIEPFLIIFSSAYVIKSIKKYTKYF